MPTSSLFPSFDPLPSSSAPANSAPSSSPDAGQNRTMQLAIELAMLQQQPNPLSGSRPSPPPSSNPLLHPFLCSLGNSSGGSLDDLSMPACSNANNKKSQNMTECVPVPTSEHVAEIVGRQGCKIKALRAKTNTYIKTPVRGEEPVFVVTGRKEDVALAKREILSAAEHFSQIRASRSKNAINSTLAFGQLVANQPGQTTTQVRVPYRVVGLVVGPKGATIKRIQQQTHTYIVTPSRDKEPVFEVTGLPENVDAARKEIEAHIAMRTGGADNNGPPGSIAGSIYGIGSSDDGNGFGSAFSSSNGHLDHLGNSSVNSKFDFSSAKSSSTFSSHVSAGMTLNSLFTNNGFDQQVHHPKLATWSNGCDSGIGSSPPFEPRTETVSTGAEIWGDLTRVLGSLDLDDPDPFTMTSKVMRGSLDMGISNSNSCSSSTSSNHQLQHTAKNPASCCSSSSSALLLSSTSSSPPTSLHFHRMSVSSEPSGNPDRHYQSGNPEYEELVAKVLKEKEENAHK